MVGSGTCNVRLRARGDRPSPKSLSVQPSMFVGGQLLCRWKSILALYLGTCDGIDRVCVSALIFQKNLSDRRWKGQRDTKTVKPNCGDAKALSLTAENDSRSHGSTAALP